MAPKPAPAAKTLTSSQVNLLVEVHKRLKTNLTLQQWDELAPAVPAKSGKSA